jgi:hypothetical protein
MVGELGTWADIIRQYFPGVEIPGVNGNQASGIKKEVKYDGFGFRGYGGLSINLFILKIDATGMIDPVNGNWGAGLGVRLQL